jgi:uncharacterized iron-regulated membrane protein
MMPNSSAPASGFAPMLALITRLHFYIGLFVGPFIFIAALTGTLYVITPQLEKQLYHHELTTPSHGVFHPLYAQITAARQSLSQDLVVKAVRPSIGEGYTTRVLFKDPSLYGWELQTVFVDPVTLKIRGHLASYGTSGILPLRIKLDYLHKDLMLGDWGRYYSELAASWMWLTALTGIVLWWVSRRRYAKVNTGNFYLRYRHRHARAGVIIAAGLLFISATGLTWSKWAGSNIAQWRHAIGWVTPSVSLKLAEEASPSAMSHGQFDHRDGENLIQGHHINDALFDDVLSAARAAGIDAAKVEIRPPSQPRQAWMVREIDRAWPTQVDTVAVDPRNMRVISRTDFENFPLIAKLIRWGIDAHMGVLFGLPNQILLAAFGMTLCLMVTWGYRMWWKRRPVPGSPGATLTQCWLAMGRIQRVAMMIITVVFATAMPVMGISLILFIMIDIVRWHRACAVRRVLYR